MNANPLLDFSGAPRYDLVAPEHVAPAISALIDEGRALIERLTNNPAEPDWDSFAMPLAEIGDRLSRAWGVVRHLHSVMDLPAWREVYNA